MILLNFAHPLTDDHLNQIRRLTAGEIERVIYLPAQFDQTRPFEPQLGELMAQITLTPEAWQSTPILVNPPALNFIAALLLAELHGRMGYFPPVIRLRPVEGALPPRYEVAEILNLQALREAARLRRRE